jgi:hypothetical protein
MCETRGNLGHRQDLASPGRRKAILGGVGLAAAPFLAGMVSEAPAQGAPGSPGNGRLLREPEYRLRNRAHQAGSDRSSLRPDQGEGREVPLCNRSHRLTAGSGEHIFVTESTCRGHVPGFIDRSPT